MEIADQRMYQDKLARKRNGIAGRADLAQTAGLR